MHVFGWGAALWPSKLLNSIFSFSHPYRIPPCHLSATSSSQLSGTKQTNAERKLRPNMQIFDDIHVTSQFDVELQFARSPLDVSLSSAWRQRRLSGDWCVSEPSVHDLSLWTRSSSIMSRGASLSKPKQENISLFRRFVSPSLHSSHIVHLPPIKVSLYCLRERIGVANRCRVIGSILAAPTGRGPRRPSSPPPSHRRHSSDGLPQPFI